jgi:threonyl-tRNA synthetase
MNENKIIIKLKNSGSYEVKENTTIYELIHNFNIHDKNNIIAAKYNNELVDLSRKIDKPGEIEFIDNKSEIGLDIYRHSVSHLLAHAVKILFPDTQIGIGPTIEDGFYYDFLRKEPFTQDDLIKIEEKMRELANQNIPIERLILKKDEAIEYFKNNNEMLKVELIQEKGGNSVSCYKQGEFMDFCLGPHIYSTGIIKAFKLLNIAGAYWKGSEKNPQLQRIYGTAFFNEEDLNNYLKKLEEIKQRDHRKLGKELDLFSIQESIGPGLILWHPKGAIIRRTIEEFWYNEHFKRGYDVVYTPHIARIEHWKTSGHWDFYRESMYSPMDVDNVNYIIKPMNCPFHLMIYKNRLRSYRDLPFRWAELGTVYRYERSGVMHGLMRVRGFTQDDAHIFCRIDQLKNEIIQLLNFSQFMLSTFGFNNYQIFLSTRPEKFVGEIEKWDIATQALKEALDETNTAYSIDPGEGVFYGPKIDIKVEDAIGRWWQLTTIQVDFQLPLRFDLNYVGQDGSPHQVIMVHRALLGSLERFLGILIEHYSGAFPLWLAPVQTIILPISEKHHAYANEIFEIIKNNGLRAELDLRNEKLNYKIREAQLQKIPFMLITGDKEEKEKTISVRSRSQGDIGTFYINNFLEIAKQLINSKSIDLTIRR